MMNEKLRTARKGRNWYQHDIAEKLEIDDGTYYAWERGAYRPNSENMQKLCKLFGLSEQELGFRPKEKTLSSNAKTARIRAEVKQMREAFRKAYPERFWSGA